MTNTAIAERTPQVIAAEILFIRDQTKSMVLSAAVEIGRRLHEAKAMLPHGTWGGWLRDNFDYSERSAQNLMGLSREYSSNPQALADLSFTNAVALLGLPGDVREEFIETHDVADMTSREVETAVRDIKRQMEEAKELAAGRQLDIDRLIQERSQLEEKAEKLERSIQDNEIAVKSNAEVIKQLRSQLKAAQDAPADDAQQDTIQRLTEELRVAEEAKGKLEADLKAEREKPITVATEIPQEVEDELAQLRSQVKRLPFEAAAEFRVRFSALSEAFNACTTALQAVRAEDHELGDKYANAIRKLMTGIEQEL